MSRVPLQHNLKVIEDCAHAIETTYRGPAAGLLGGNGCFSFCPTKASPRATVGARTTSLPLIAAMTEADG